MLYSQMDTSDDDLQSDVSELNSANEAEWVRTKVEMGHYRKKQLKFDNQEGLGYSCSTSSLCKTNGGKCRAAKNCCGSSCSCRPKKCRNKEEASEKSHVLAAEGAKLLHSALSENPVITNDGGAERKE
ncbi:unnamed protein product [Fraxinus pennsylvanica]|uniref:Uncharacterized protein n=1 Tax=Fraxinus pennsylvanica TaxID=56036 RepID=A0AAD1YS36_9LAMI|nr:unnamed protein product [Fraxinus pennsylvanica]